MFYSGNTGYTIAVFSLHVGYPVMDSVVSASTGQTTDFLKNNFMNKHNVSGFECFTGDEYMRVGILILATPRKLDTRTAGVTCQGSRKDGSFPYLHT